MLEVFFNLILSICSPQMTGQIGIHVFQPSHLQLFPEIISRFFLEEVKAKDQIFMALILLEL